MRDYDHLTPLICGDVETEGLALCLEREPDQMLQRTLNDPEVEAGELSFSRHLIRLAQGDRSWAGLPVFPTRAFRHRCFFVRRESELQSLEELQGKRVGTNDWAATGNVWSRAALREAGVAPEGIAWWVGPVDDAAARRPQGTLPPYARLSDADRTLRELLLAEELDALMVPYPPAGFYKPDSPLQRLFPDYRRAEQAYFRRTGLYPAHHLVGLRRDVFEKEPWLAGALFRALDRSMARWQARRLYLAETSPWLLADLEEARALMGRDWQPNGSAPNRAMVQALCDELDAQGLLSRPLDGNTVFQEFEQALAEVGPMPLPETGFGEAPSSRS